MVLCSKYQHIPAGQCKPVSQSKDFDDRQGLRVGRHSLPDVWKSDDIRSLYKNDVPVYVQLCVGKTSECRGIAGPHPANVV